MEKFDLSAYDGLPPSTLLDSKTIFRITGWGKNINLHTKKGFPKPEVKILNARFWQNERAYWKLGVIRKYLEEIC